MFERKNRAKKCKKVSKNMMKLGMREFVKKVTFSGGLHNKIGQKSEKTARKRVVFLSKFTLF